MRGMVDDRFINRELSWLAFDERVLDLATEDGIPLLERAKFCAITSSNLDEFFQVRVAALKDQVAARIEEPTPDGRTASQQLAEISEATRRLVERQELVFVDSLAPALAGAGIAIVRWRDLSVADRKTMTEVYDERVFPVLTPLAVDPSHPFPYISDLALSVAAFVGDPESGEQRFARVKVPDLFPRLVPVDEHRYLPAEELVIAHLDSLFAGMVIKEAAAFRVTRNADLTVEEEEADDLLEAVEMELRRRRFNRAVRLEVAETMGDEMLELLVRELDLHPNDVYRLRGPISLDFLWQLHALDRPDLKDRSWPPITPGRISVGLEAERPIVSVMRDRAIMVHHPYESFATSTEAFIEQAAADPRVQSIKMTLYRAGGDSQIIRALIRAAERGVQVAVLVELKARFDEANNVNWAKQLERAGVHVIYGMVGLKTHSKCVLVVRDDGDQLRRYCHIGTGNYNTNTARIYEDLGILTCDIDVGADVAKLFNHLTGYSRDDAYHTLVVAPRDLRPRLLELIEGEIALGTKAASSSRPTPSPTPRWSRRCTGRALPGCRSISSSAASRRCAPAFPGSPRTSGCGASSAAISNTAGSITSPTAMSTAAPLYLIGSADLMPRNLDRRVEVLVPIEHPKHQEWIDAVLDFLLADDIVRWELQPDDTWVRRGPEGTFEPNAQSRLYQWVVDRQSGGVRS